MPSHLTRIALVAAACLFPFSSPAQPADGEKSITVYAGRFNERVATAFTESTGIEVTIVGGRLDDVIDDIAKEGRHVADVVIGGDLAGLARLEEAGAFERLSSAKIKEVIPASLRHPEGLWFATFRRARVIFYNADILPTPPKNYQNLADPMRLTRQSEIAVYTLLRCAARPNDRVHTREVAEGYGTTKAYAAHIVARLVRHGLLHGCRGRTGGLRLARHPADIPIGTIVRVMQPMAGNPRKRRMSDGPSPKTGFDAVLLVAMNSFLATLDDFPLVDLLAENTGRLACLDCELKASVLRSRARAMSGPVESSLLPSGTAPAAGGLRWQGRGKRQKTNRVFT